MIYGVLFLFFIVGFFLLFPFETYMSPEIYFRQKIINFFIYACFIIVFFYSYVSTIKTYEESLHKKSLKIDYLLKTLLHDVSNPVQILSLLLPRFKQEIDSESYDKLWRNHQAIVNIIKDVQRLEGSSSDEKLVREEISCKELLDKAKLRQSEALESKSINLIIENQLGDELINVSPSIFINQILNNLITNAIKFSDDGKDIILKAFRKNSSIFFEVRDYGVGIEEAKVKSLFDIYSVSSTAGTNGEQGTGFGLPLVKYYLDQHQGEIKVDSAPFSDNIDQGTSFLIRLPVT
jgi:signal transduction histidine kinase